MKNLYLSFYILATPILSIDNNNLSNMILNLKYNFRDTFRLEIYLNIYVFFIKDINYDIFFTIGKVTTL